MPSRDSYIVKDLMDVGSFSTHRIQPKLTRFNTEPSYRVKPNIWGPFELVPVPSSLKTNKTTTTTSSTFTGTTTTTTSSQRRNPSEKLPPPPPPSLHQHPHQHQQPQYQGCRPNFFSLSKGIFDHAGPAEKLAQKIKMVNRQEKKFDKAQQNSAKAMNTTTTMATVNVVSKPALKRVILPKLSPSQSKERALRRTKTVKGELAYRDKIVRKHKEKEKKYKESHEKSRGKWIDHVMKERRDVRFEKLMKKQRDEDTKFKQRQEIYALNDVMKQLEHTHFQMFCESIGMKHRGTQETSPCLDDSIFSQNFII